jgi:hypothetical protein
MPFVMLRRRALLASLVTVVAAPAALSFGRLARRAPRPESPPPVIEWSLTTVPATATITMAQRRRFRLWLVARNVGASVADTQRDALEWTVNGQPSMALSMAFGNGVRENRWSALAPRDTVREARDMGESLFERPGVYIIALRAAGREAARITVRVRAR